MNHIEFLIEDKSGKAALEQLLPKIVGDEVTFQVHSYKGIGHIPKGLKPAHDASKRILLDQLPKLLSGYGRTFASYPEEYVCAVVVICDLDDRDLSEFLTQLCQISDACMPRPNSRFCIAVEEGEAWLLGDREAILAAYPDASQVALANYVQDSICGTWEALASVIYPGGVDVLRNQGPQEVGRQKSIWATKICPFMEPENNASPSFRFFVETVRRLLAPAQA